MLISLGLDPNITIDDLLEKPGHCLECHNPLSNDTVLYLVRCISKITYDNKNITDEFKKHTMKLIIRKSICDICYRELKIKFLLEE